MDPREPAKPGHTFDPRPLEALEQELTRRVGARDRAFTVESWEFGGVQRPAAPGAPALAPGWCAARWRPPWRAWSAACSPCRN